MVSWLCVQEEWTEGPPSSMAATGEQEADKPAEVAVHRLTMRKPREMQVDVTREDFQWCGKLEEVAKEDEEGSVREAG